MIFPVLDLVPSTKNSR